MTPVNPIEWTFYVFPQHQTSHARDTTYLCVLFVCIMRVCVYFLGGGEVRQYK